jgi:hypothetical protein
MERGLRERIDGWVLRDELYDRDKKISSQLGVEMIRSVKVSAKANDHFLSSEHQKKCFLKN